jgi:hypothetical protein
VDGLHLSLAVSKIYLSPKGTKKYQFLKYGFVHYSTKFNGFLCKILRNKEKYKQILIGKLA